MSSAMVCGDRRDTVPWLAKTQMTKIMAPIIKSEE